MSAKRSDKSIAARKESGPSTWAIAFYVAADGSAPVTDGVLSRELKRVAWLALVEFALGPHGKDIEQAG